MDVVVADRRILRYFNRDLYRQVNVGQPLTEYPLTPYQLGLRDRFDRGLAAIITSGEYREIERRYAQ